MKTIIVSSIILVMMFVNLFSQQERLEKISQKERLLNTFSKSAFIDSTKLDFLIDSIMIADHIPGLTALINTKDDEIIWKRNYGYANLEMQQTVEDSTLFLIASISKTIIVTAIMQFWEADSFDLDDDINNYLEGFQVINPSYPNDTITFRKLMTHTSSIKDNWNILSPLVTCGDSPIPLDSFLVKYFTPGEIYYNPENFNTWSPDSNFYNYTSIGTSILAYLVEKFSGASFDQYCREYIFNPLEMNKTSWFLEGLDTTTIATPYEWSGANYVANCHHGLPIYPSGFLRTNKIELEKFLSAYMNWGYYKGTTILDSSTVDLILSNHWGSYPEIHGLIWYQTSKVNSRLLWGHEGGWISGARTAMFFQKDENWGIIYFMNMYYGGSSPVHLFILNTLCDYAQNITRVEEIGGGLIEFYLEQNFPNPFNLNTTIKYKIPEMSFVTLTVYDILGCEIVTLVNEEKPVGTHIIEFDASNLPSGIYFYQMQTQSFMQTKKMILLK